MPPPLGIFTTYRESKPIGSISSSTSSSVVSESLDQRPYVIDKSTSAASIALSNKDRLKEGVIKAKYFREPTLAFVARARSDPLVALGDPVAPYQNHRYHGTLMEYEDIRSRVSRKDNQIGTAAVSEGLAVDRSLKESVEGRLPDEQQRAIFPLVYPVLEEFYPGYLRYRTVNNHPSEAVSAESAVSHKNEINSARLNPPERVESSLGPSHSGASPQKPAPFESISLSNSIPSLTNMDDADWDKLPRPDTHFYPQHPSHQPTKPSRSTMSPIYETYTSNLDRIRGPLQYSSEGPLIPAETGEYVELEIPVHTSPAPIPSSKAASKKQDQDGKSGTSNLKDRTVPPISTLPEAKNGGAGTDHARRRKSLGRVVKNYVTGSNRLPKSGDDESKYGSDESERTQANDRKTLRSEEAEVAMQNMRAVLSEGHRIHGHGGLEKEEVLSEGLEFKRAQKVALRAAKQRRKAANIELVEYVPAKNE